MAGLATTPRYLTHLHRRYLTSKKPIRRLFFIRNSLEARSSSVCLSLRTLMKSRCFRS